MPPPPSECREPWKRCRFSLRQRNGRTTVETVPERVAVKWAPRLGRRLRELLRESGPVRTIGSLGILLLELDEASRRPAAWKRLKKLQKEGVVAWASPLLRDLESELREILTDEVTVRLRPGADADRRLQDLLRRTGLVLARRNEFVPNQFVLRIDHPFGLEVLEVARSLDTRAEVEFATPNFVSEVSR